MPQVFKYNLQQADFPFIAEDYGSIANTYIDDNLDFGEGLPVQTQPDYSTDLYYPLDASGNLLDNPATSDETVPTYDSSTLTSDISYNSPNNVPDLPYLNYGFIWETVDQYPGGGLTVEGITGEAKTTKDYTPPLDLYIILAGEVLKKLVKVWVGTGQLFEIREDGGIRLIRSTDSSGTLRFDTSVGATDVKVTFDPAENEQLFSITGSSVEKFVVNPPEDTQLFSTGGAGATKVEWNYGYYGDDRDPGTSGQIIINSASAASVKFIADYENSILVGFSGEKLESRTHNYNLESFGFTEEDWGYITDPAGALDWESITTTPNQRPENWGLILENYLNTNPFGSILFDQTTEGDTRLLYTYIITGAGTSGAITISGTPLVHPDVDYTPHYGIDKNIGIGTTGIQISGEIENPTRTFSHVGLGTLFTAIGAAESITWDPPVGTILYDFTGTGRERLSAQTPEETVNIVVSGVGTDEKFTAREVGDPGIISITGESVVFVANFYEGTGITTISGVASCREVGVYGYYGDDRDPGTSGIITVRGELNHPDIDYTPHYGIDQNIGVGTTGIKFAIGPFGFDIVGNPVGGRYYMPIYPRGAGGIGGPGSPGIGTFRLNDDKELTITRALLPYSGGGTISLTGIGSEAYVNQVDDDVTTALFDISGVGSCREIQVYGYYGDLRDPGTSGIITISTQTADTVEKVTFDYVGSGTYTVSSAASDIKFVSAYEGSGSLFAFDGLVESVGARPGQNVILFEVDGAATESYSRAPVIGVGTIFVSGDTPAENLTFAEQSDGGVISLSGACVDRFIPHVSGGGLFKIGKRDPGCDSVDITCDGQDESNNSFTRNTQQITSTALLQFSDAASTAEEDLFVYNGSGSLTLTSQGETKVLLSFAKEGTGLFTISGIGAESFSRTGYDGSGTFSTLNGAAERFRYDPNEGTILYDVYGDANTALESDYPYAGIGTVYVSGIASTKQEFRVSVESETVLFRLYGELLFPDVRFIPNFNGGGTINIIGSGNESIARPYEGTGGLFGLASGLEAYARTPYIGVGTIYLGKYDPNGEAAQGPGGLGGLAGGGASGGGTQKRNYEPPRVFVSII